MVSPAICSAACTAFSTEISACSRSTMAPPLMPRLACWPMPMTRGMAAPSARAMKQQTLLLPISRAAARPPFTRPFLIWRCGLLLGCSARCGASRAFPLDFLFAERAPGGIGAHHQAVGQAPVDDADVARTQALLAPGAGELGPGVGRAGLRQAHVDAVGRAAWRERG